MAVALVLVVLVVVLVVVVCGSNWEEDVTQSIATGGWGEEEDNSLHQDRKQREIACLLGKIDIPLITGL